MLRQQLKQLSKHPIVHSIGAFLGALYIRFVLLTSKVHLHVDAGAAPFFAGDQPAIYTLWHSRLMLIHAHFPQKRPLAAMVSEHRDGRMTGDILRYFRVTPVHGSSSGSGARALKELIRRYREGHNVCITPDGPRGPARQVADGVAQLGLMTQAPIICVAYAATRVKLLRSWDRFMFTLPFSQIHFVAEAPIYLKQDEGLSKHEQRDALRQMIDTTLNDVTDRADKLAGLL